MWVKEHQQKIRREKNFIKTKVSLNLFDDQHSVLRLKGRYANSERSNFDQKHPNLSLGESHLCRLIMLDAHKRILHQGVENTLNEV